MEQSILNSTKKILGIDPEYTPFDLDILTHINTSLSILNQIGIGPEGGLVVENSNSKWESLSVDPDQLSMIRSYIPLKVRMFFDPPTTSFLIDAVNDQIKELLYRLSDTVEAKIPVPTPSIPQGGDCVW